MTAVYKASNPQLATAALVPETHYGPATAVKFLSNNVILAANGPNLQVYRDSQLDRTIRIFGKQKIHGMDISKTRTDIILWGGRSFTVVSVQDLLDAPEPAVKECAINDWIMAMTFDWSGENCYLLTSHNIVFTVELGTMHVVDTKTFLENSILYSGAIKVLPEKVLIAAGTILGGVFVWELSRSKLVHNLIGHEGAIFGVAFSDNAEFLCSCSDDRSIRVWDLDTGSNSCTGWGHHSRIWQLQWYNGNMIMSCGEDATARVWEFVKNEEKTLFCLDVWELHLGKHIWSGDVNQELQIAVTGGADGRIRLVDLAKHTRKDNWRKEFDISVISSIKADYFKNYVQFQDGLIVLSAAGYCYKFSKFSTWELLFKDADLGNFQILNSLPKDGLVAITSKTGSTILLKFDDNFNLVKKVTVPKPEQIRTNVTNVLIAKKSSTAFLLFHESPNPKEEFVLYEMDFGLGTDPVVTTIKKPDTRFSTTAIAYDPLNSWLFIGSRYVTFMIVDFADNSRRNVWKKFIKGDTITSCSIVNSKKSEIIILMTVRDGDYLYLRLNDDFELEVLQHNTIQRGFLEGGYIDGNGELILLNFKSDTFHLWNETRQFEIFKELCGGSHRTWNLNSNDDDTQNFNFVYNKASHLIIVNTGDQVYKNSCLNGGTHGREIRDITISEEARGNGAKLILTGGEDTVVKLSEINSSGHIKNFVSLRHHVSGIQKVKFIKGSQFAASTAAREELFIWKINDDYTTLGPFISRYAVLPPSSSEPDLRIMDFDTVRIYKEDFFYGWLFVNVYSDSSIKIFEFNVTTKQFKMVLEDRYSTCCLWDARFITVSDRLYTLIGGTDGHISVYDLTEEAQKLYEVSEKGVLFLKEQPTLVVDPEVEAEIGTKFETVPLFPELIIKQQIHQSGIKSLLVIRDPQGPAIFDLVTAGDDNALIQTRLKFNNRTIDLDIVAFYENAASCTITSVSLFADSQTGSLQKEIFAVSVDQIARLWQIDYSADAKLRCVDSRYTTVGDTGSSDTGCVGGKRLALIGGAGLSCWRLAESK